MSLGQIAKTIYRTRIGTYPIFRADTQLQSDLPALALPPMNTAARAAFMAVLAHEKPTSNGSLADCLALAEARGFSAHPGDWIPDFKSPGHHSPLYQPWVDWLSDHGLTPFHEENALTAENWQRWKPYPRTKAFRKLILNAPDAAFDLLRRVGPSQPASTRLTLLAQVDAGGSFYGNTPRQVPILKYFLDDPSAKIRDAAREKLERMKGLETEEAHAAELAKHIEVVGDRVTYKVPQGPYICPFSVNWFSTTFNALAEALHLSPQELALKSDPEALGSEFMLCAIRTADVETRSIIARRHLDTVRPEGVYPRLFDGSARPLRDGCLRLVFKSHYYSSVHDVLGPEMGTLNALQMRDLKCYEDLAESVTTELETGKLPVNDSYDPLRAVAFSIDKAAAEEVLEEALSLGMRIDNPRLTMLKFNLAL